MAVLISSNKELLRNWFGDDLSHAEEPREPVTVVKADILAAFDAIATAVNTNEGALLAAMPAGAKSDMLAWIRDALRRGLPAGVEAAIDQLVSDNAAALNTVLPEPFKSSATAAQKERIVKMVMRFHLLLKVLTDG